MTKQVIIGPTIMRARAKSERGSIPSFPRVSGARGIPILRSQPHENRQSLVKGRDQARPNTRPQSEEVESGTQTFVSRKQLNTRQAIVEIKPGAGEGGAELSA